MIFEEYFLHLFGVQVNRPPKYFSVGENTRYGLIFEVVRF